MNLHSRACSTPVTLRAVALRLCALATALLLAATVSAQTSPNAGTVTGTVSNVATGANLEGAEVTLQPGNISVLTARDGRFAVPNLAPGLYSVTAFYSGLDAKTIEARVTTGAASSYDIGLSSS